MNNVAQNWVSLALDRLRQITRPRALWLLACALGASALVGCQHPVPQGSSAESLQVGEAEVDITPPVGSRMAGYFYERISTGIHDRLHAKAMVLRQGATEIALESCDLIGVSLSQTSKARAEVSEQTGIPVTNIVICAIHTHTGPLFDGALRDYFHDAAVKKYGYDPHEQVDYPSFLVKRMVQAIVAARQNLRPAILDAGIAKQEGLSFNRRYWMKNGKVVFNPGQLNPNIVRPAGPIDPDVGILLARDAKTRKPFVGLTVFAVHSDTTGGTHFSADYEYYLEQTLRGAFGKNYLSVYGLGTCGDINHINVKNKDPYYGAKVAGHIGGTLGRTVLAAVPDLQPITQPALAVRSTTLQVPLQEVTPEQVEKARAVMRKFDDHGTSFLAKVAAVRVLDLEKLGATRPMEVQVFRLDANTAVVCLPAEIFVDLGLAIKRASPFRHTLVISICNDRPSYVPTREAFAQGSYEVTNSRVKPGAGEMLVAAAEKLLGELKE
jgi:Neutral/alkaline non-lysosomal ceramidase, N-terminal